MSITQRDWGGWKVLDHQPDKNFKIKQLIIEPGKSLSNQRHFKRSETWIILEGVVKMETRWKNLDDIIHLHPRSLPYEIKKKVWHKASNPGASTVYVLEIQRGSECIEEDIERSDRTLEEGKEYSMNDPIWDKRWTSC